MTTPTITRPYGPQNGGFPSEEVMRGVLAVKLGMENVHLEDEDAE